MTQPSQKIRQFELFATEPPNLSVLSDNPLTDDELYNASFNLSYHLGPIYDIIRDKNQQTPLTIALYGTWGSGKTTALLWLEKNIQIWNEKADIEDKINIRTVWFFPWKYQNKEDIYKGLLSEVILEAITVKSIDKKQIIKGLKLLGGFVGRSIVNIASSLKFNLLGVEVDTKIIKKIIRDFQETAHPESPYLHKLEKEFHNWVSDILGKDNSRMVIFIDDLDRCMPDIALQVLEALKLYLNIKGLIFIIGIDKPVIENAVAAYLEEHHIKKVDYKMYLSKMFQVETVISPAESEVAQFMDDLLKDVHFEDKLNDKQFFPLFHRLIKNYGHNNPREVKRIINNCLKAGSGAKKLKTQTPDKTFTFEQGLQMYFIRRIVADYTGLSDIIGTIDADDFFAQWSEIVRNNPDKPRIIPPKVIDEIYQQKKRTPTTIDEAFEGPYKELKNNDLGHFEDIFNQERFNSFLILMQNEDLGKLMQIEFKPLLAKETRKEQIITEKSEDSQIILRQIASELEKDIDKLTEDDFKKVTYLDLTGLNISDIDALKGLTNLQTLYLYETHVSNIDTLKNLTNLRELDLSETEVSNIDALKGLTNLQWLDLSRTQVSNIDALKGLTNLQHLSLTETEVSNIDALKVLTNLQVLNLFGTQVSNIDALKGLTNLKYLELTRTQVSNIDALKGLTNLQKLYIIGCENIPQQQIKDLKKINPKLKIIQ
jgi:hypothetical protein